MSVRKILKKFIPRLLINYGKHLPEAYLANLKYGFPSHRMTIVGVTGTDGKTTTVNMIYSILKAAGKKVSMISTINAFIGDKSYDTGFHVTSPHSAQLQKLIKQAKAAGSEIMILEVTSHALDQFRFWGIKFDIGVITNITQEHLDYHKSLENYLLSKAKLIKDVKVAILNYDDENFPRLSKLTTGEIVSFGLNKKADFNLSNFPMKLKVPGDFNLLNGLSAAAVCTKLRIDKSMILQALSQYRGISGRMEEIQNKRDLRIFIDFAHTPNGLTQALKALKEMRKGKIIALIGAEGERDPGKRPLLGQIAAELADYVIVTAVDPRGELDKINAEIMAGVEKAGGRLGQNIFVINDRRKAIDFAINSLAKKGDTVGIFGKGHEKSMNLDGKHELPWSDIEAVEKVLA